MKHNGFSANKLQKYDIESVFATDEPLDGFQTILEGFFVIIIRK